MKKLLTISLCLVLCAVMMVPTCALIFNAPTEGPFEPVPDNIVCDPAQWTEFLRLRPDALVSEEGFVYNLYEDGTVFVLVYLGKEVDITIPAEIDGHKVAGVSSSAFTTTGSMFPIDIPSPTAIHSIVVSEGIESIGFQGAAAVSITLPKSVHTLTTISECGELESIVIPEGMTEIPGNEFYFGGCFSLKEVTLPKSLIKVNKDFEALFELGKTQKQMGNPFVIRGYKDSAAMEFAEKYDIDFYCIDGVNTTGTGVHELVPGDINGDNLINMKDVLLLRKHIAGLAGIDAVPAMDLNGDALVNMKDVLAIRKTIAGITA